MNRIRNGTQAGFNALLFVLYLLQFATLSLDADFRVSVGAIVFWVLMILWETLLLRRLILACDRLILDEHGIRVKRFGRIIRDFSWSEIREYGIASTDDGKAPKAITTMYFSLVPLYDEARIRAVLYESYFFLPMLNDRNIIAVDCIRQKNNGVELDQKLMAQIPYPMFHRTDLYAMWVNFTCAYCDSEGQTHYIDRKTAKPLTRRICAPFIVLFIALLLALILSFAIQPAFSAAL